LYDARRSERFHLHRDVAIRWEAQKYIAGGQPFRTGGISLEMNLFGSSTVREQGLAGGFWDDNFQNQAVRA
jgi:hypothetical protein